MRFEELIGNAILGIDTLWGGDVMNPSGTGRYIADSWFSDEPLPEAYTHPAAARLRETGGVAARSRDDAAIDAYLAAIDVPGAIEAATAEGRALGGLRGAYLASQGESLRVIWELVQELRAGVDRVTLGQDADDRRRVPLILPRRQPPARYRDHHGAVRPLAQSSPRPCLAPRDAPCSSATASSAPSPTPKAVAVPKPAGWSSITSSPVRAMAPTTPPICASGAVPTTGSTPSTSSARTTSSTASARVAIRASAGRTTSLRRAAC